MQGAGNLMHEILSSKIKRKKPSHFTISSDIKRNNVGQGLRGMRIDGIETYTHVHQKSQAHTFVSVKKQVDETHEPSKDKIEQIVEELQAFTKPLRTSIQFELHEDLDEYYVTVVDPLTKEVIKEIPPKKMLDMYAAMYTHMGILIDDKV